MTSSRRGNILDALFLPSPAARKRFEELPLTGSDLFAGQFEDMMQAKAKRLKATEKINLNKPPASRMPTQAKKATFTIPRRKPFKAPRGNTRTRTHATLGTRPGRAQRQTGQPQRQTGRTARAPIPRYSGGGRR